MSRQENRPEGIKIVCPFHAKRLAMQTQQVPAPTTAVSLENEKSQNQAMKRSGYLRHDVKSYSIDQPDAQLTGLRPSPLEERARHQHMSFHRHMQLQQQRRTRKLALTLQSNPSSTSSIDVSNIVSTITKMDMAPTTSTQHVTNHAVPSLARSEATTATTIMHDIVPVPVEPTAAINHPHRSSTSSVTASPLTPNRKSFPYLPAALLHNTALVPGGAQAPHYPTVNIMFPQSAAEAVRVSDLGDGYVYLNQYKLSNETLGHGTYSIVKLAYNTEDNTHYAMKILSKKKLMKKHRMSRKSGDPMQEAYREIAILKKLNHPNIIRLVEVLDDPGTEDLYLVFELLERGEVLAIPTDNPLPESVAWAYFRDLILGVEYLHHNGILHRDLKPSNLLLDDSNHLKIADFGLSHMFEGPDVFLTSTAGTPAFHAPEILHQTTPDIDVALSRQGSLKDKPLPREGVSGVAMDIWSMGITLFSLVFGDVPFRDDSVIELYNHIRNADPLFPERMPISDSLRDIILRLLEKDPSKRITITEMREHPWVTRAGREPLLPKRPENCSTTIQVTEEEIQASIRSIPHLDTLILIKAMLKRASFHHPFKGDLWDTRKGSLDSNLPPPD